MATASILVPSPRVRLIWSPGCPYQTRGIPLLRVGATDGVSGSLEIQDSADSSIAALRADMRATLPQLFG